MRAVFAVALCFVLGACAMFGRGGPDPYGIYDLVSANGETLPAAEVTGGWFEIRPDGTSTLEMTVPGQPEPARFDTEFSLGEMANGCFPFSSTGDDGTEWTGSICGDVFTVEGPGQTVVMHKRR